MKILVTGSAGFIGNHLVKTLRERKHEITEFDLKLGNDITKEIPGDYDIIYHLAAYTLIQARSNPQKAIDVNIKGTLNILELVRKCDAKVIFTSASSVYGVPRSVPIKEDTFLHPTSLYGATKVAGETLIQTYASIYGIKYFISRCSNVYGQKQTMGIIPTIMDQIRKEERVFITGKGTQTRDFIYVADLVHFLCRAMEIKENITANIGSGKETSINELVEMCYQIANKPINCLHTQQDMDERQRFCADISQLKEIFDEEPKTNLQEGLIKTWEGFE